MLQSVEEQLLFGLEVVLHEPERYAGLGGHVAHADGVQPSPPRDLDERFGDLGAPFLVVHALWHECCLRPWGWDGWCRGSRFGSVRTSSWYRCINNMVRSYHEEPIFLEVPRAREHDPSAPRHRPLRERRTARPVLRHLRRPLREGSARSLRNGRRDELRHHPRLPVWPRRSGSRLTYARGPDTRFGRLLRPVVSQHPCPQRRAPRLRSRHSR